MPKYDFSLKTRDGQTVETILIYGNDQEDAERKLRQMYHHCEVLKCDVINSERVLGQSADIEEVLTLITKHS